VWLVGYANSFGGGGGTVVLRWYGSSWSVGQAPSPESLSSVTALSATDIWATGTDSSGQLQLANWRGFGWTLHPAPTLAGQATCRP